MSDISLNEDTIQGPALATSAILVRPTDADLIGAVVAAWVRQHLANSPVSRDTAAWNHLTAALPALTAAVVAATTKE